MPLYEYRCPEGHLTKRLVSWKQKPETVPCRECGEDARWLFPTPLLEPEGTHSHTPNIGRPPEERQKTMSDPEYWKQ